MSIVDLVKEAMEVDEQLLNEMARVGFMNDDKYEIWIRTDDPGKYPHMHIWDYSTKGKKFHCCVRLDKPEYFIHTGKEDTLNSTNKKELIKFLNKEYGGLGITNWKRILMLWNDNNSDVHIDIDSEMPDYTKL